MSTNLARRLAVAAVGIPVVLVVAWLGGFFLVAGLSLLAGIGTWELGRMLGAKQAAFQAGLAIPGAMLLPPAVFLYGASGAAVVLTLLWLALAGHATLRLPPGQGPFRVASTGFAAAAYVGGLLCYALLLRESMAADQRAGMTWFLLPVLLTWFADTAAYFVGRAFGRRPLAPTVSPNKTVEGGVAALAAGLIGALLLARAVPDLAAVGIAGVALVGVLVAAAAIVGDLAESAVKRECGFKDSSDLLPGHGGLLDRMDSLLWAFPTAYLLLGVLL